MLGRVWVLAVLGCGIAGGQTTRGVGAAARPITFEVVSIQASRPGSPWGWVQVLPDGYRAIGIGLWATVARAYFPADVYTPDRLQGVQP